MGRNQLRRVLIAHFDDSELRDLCFELGCDYDDLPGESKVDKARELVARFERRGELYALIRRVDMLRPNVLEPLVGRRRLPPIPESARMNGDSLWYVYVRDTLAEVDRRLDMLTVGFATATLFSLVDFVLLLALLIAK
jgi:hypothetical protein